MLQIIENLPSHVVGARATGEVTKEDYETKLIPAVERATKAHDKINFIMVLETDIQNFTVAAWMHDAYMSLKNYNNWKRVATVSDQKIADKLTDALKYVFPGDAKGFTVDEMEQAIKWVSSVPA